jgi:MoCo/4Fe-4S cofactor protein with predicted Tat translocation signal
MSDSRTSSAPSASPEAGDCHVEWKRPAAEAAAVDLATVRARLAERRGPQYWRSLEEVAATPEFGEMLHREFPRFASEWPDGVSRRNFLQLAAASLGLAGLTACTRQPIEKIVPYVHQPEEIIPGRPLFFATAMPLGGVLEPLLAESHEGRPTKLEGNPEHPASRGATTAIAQASVLGLYDPDRSQALTHLGSVSEWAALQQALANALDGAAKNQGAGLRLLTGPTSSPTEAMLISEVRSAYPNAKWHRWDPIGRDAWRAGAKLAFGRAVDVRYDLARADVIVAIDSDLLVSGPGAVRHARDYASRRRPTPETPEMNRLYVAEATPSPTGTMADHRLALTPAHLRGVVAALAAEIGVGGAAAPAGLDEPTRRFVSAAARDLAAHRGRALVVVGETLPASAHAAAIAMNAALDAVGSTLEYFDPIEIDPADGAESLAELTHELAAGQVELLILSGVNPVYDAPADLEFAAALNRQETLRIHHGLYADETAAYCQWHVPATHFLEEWSDGRAADGTVTLVQPLIEPLYGGKSWIELLAFVAGRGEVAGHDLVRERWSALSDDQFRKTLHDGFVATSAPGAVEVTPGDVGGALRDLATAPAADGYELALRPDPSVLDGRFANNGWLQELPKPVTKLTWSNGLLLSPRTAEKLGVRNGQVVKVEAGGRVLEAVPAWILPGQADGVALLHLGYGRRIGHVAGDLGASAYALQTMVARWNLSGVRLTPGSERVELACTQGHYMIDNWLEDETEEATKRHVVQAATLDEFKRDPGFAHEENPRLDASQSFAPGYAYDGYAWGMTIDLSTCTGCNACAMACQAENNIAVVGAEQVRRGREMNWIRIDRYYKGDLDAPEAIVHQPIPCMQCEQAPCETVCPVGATVHSSDGLNDMVYNRCVGTRYCLNNCPYKVRRFNFLLYQDWETPQLQLQRNPDVTVRSRGVMEKCTYCVQRIRHAGIDAEREGRKIRDGEVRTACQQACPPNAITFGDINDAESQVARWKKDPRNYALLEELGTRPRTTYLAQIKNPNPELVG